ncbi:PAS domain-containing protein [Scandinavium goeteborgense]|uniref:PAS domain-containing protein n=1 Tax=Scandinavium goeteborgense TaxID=1851514 RepID=UPI00381045D0
MAVRDRIALFKGYQAVNDAAASISMSRIFFYESTTEPCGAKDLDLRFIYANKAYRKSLNLPLNFDVTGKTFEEMTGENIALTGDISRHERQIITSARASFAREFLASGDASHPIPYVFLRTPHFSDSGDVSALEFYAFSWHKFSSMHHHDPTAIIKDGKLLTPYDLLTDKQWSALYLYCTGLCHKEIADLKAISVSAIKKSIKRSTEIVQHALQTDTSRSIVPTIINMGWMNFLPSDFIDKYQQYTVYNFPL